MTALDPKFLRVEIERLRTEIAQLEVLKRRLKALEELLATFEQDAGMDKGAEKSSSQVNSPPPPNFSGVRAGTAEKLRAVWKILAERGRPVRTSDLVEELEFQGIQIAGRNKVATLSAALSHSPYFETQGRAHGWQIRQDASSQSNEA